MNEDKVLAEFKKTRAYEIIYDELNRKMQSVLTDIKNVKEERREYKAGMLVGLEQYTKIIDRIIANGDSTKLKEV